MTSVFVLTSWFIDDSDTVGVYTTRALAEAEQHKLEINEMQHNAPFSRRHYFVDEVPVDKPVAMLPAKA